MDAFELLSEVSKEEVEEVLKYMKAFKKFWHIVGDDIYSLVRQAFLLGSFDAHLLEILIVSIPTVDVPNRFSHFRPISLCNVTYKIITKVLVNRLRPFLKDIVDPL